MCVVQNVGIFKKSPKGIEEDNEVGIELIGSKVMTGGDDFVGSISLFAGSYAPEGYMDCDGRSLQVQQHQVLYAIIGNDYGGTATTFSLPDLRTKDKDGKPLPFTRGKPRYCICIQGLWPNRP